MDINNSNYIFSTRDVIEIQSRYYYQQKEELGFFTLSETLNEYADFVARHISRLWKLSTPLNTKDEKRIKIIELGPGTGRFTKRLLNILKENNIFVEYTMVDLNPLLRSLAEETEAIFYNCSFEVFTQSFDQEYDFFILNESLEMWAGEHISIDEDGN